MKAVNELLKMGFNLSIKDGNIKLESKRVNHLDLATAKPMIEEIKLNKEKAIKYIQSLIIYEIHQADNFDFQVQACLDAAINNDIQWLRTDVYKESGKVVLVGAIKKPEQVIIWHEVNKEIEFYIDNPWKPERLVM